MRGLLGRWRERHQPPPVSTATVLSLDDFNAMLGSLRGERPDAEEYQRLPSVALHVPQAEALKRLDPFSDAYRASAMELYLLLRGQGGDYAAGRDEAAETMPIGNAFRDMAPWNFGDVRLTAEFLHAWAQIMQLLDIVPGRRTRVLEYGCASGQFLLMLARMGVEAFGVDIDARMLGLLRAQAEAMGVSVMAERAEFGEGFGEERFDRLVFFESFHHAFDAASLLRRLRRRLKPGGRLVLCGEPVMDRANEIVPYPWGPRLDGLSVYCIRQYGWMELGFTREFLTEAMRRTGWDLQQHDFPGVARANAFVASPTVIERVGPVIRLDANATTCDWREGWFSPEPHQRWTGGGTAGVRLPANAKGADVALIVSNHLPMPKAVTVLCGQREVTVKLDAAERDREIFLPYCAETLILISCDGHRPCDFIPGNDDSRDLGIALQHIQVEPLELTAPR